MIFPDRLHLRVDEQFPADRSVILRYAPTLLADLLSPEELLAQSQGEGMRLVELGTVGGVDLLLLDETTRMRTGTYKSLGGCLATALCRKLGITRAVFSSGANTGVALTDYGARTGLESFFFCPATTVHKLEGQLFERSTAHLIAVEGPDRRVKGAAGAFAELLDLPVIPRLEWRLLAAACRGLFIAEELLKSGRRCSWLTQAVCAGYGPIGIYRALSALAEAGEIDRSSVPRFMGVQQAGMSPMANAWADGCSSLQPLASTEWHDRSIEPSLYNVYPEQTYPWLYSVLKDSGGDMLTVSAAEYDERAGEFLDLLQRAGIDLTRICVDGKERVLEQAGLLAGVGTLKAIAEGRIAKGETVVCSLTGGAGPAPMRPAQAECRIAIGAPLDQAVAEFVETVKET